MSAGSRDEGPERYVIDGIDFGSGSDAALTVCRRLRGEMDWIGDPLDPTRHLWLEQAYWTLLARNAHEPLARAYASLAADPDPDVCAGVLHFLSEFPDAPGAAQALLRAIEADRSAYARKPDPIGMSPAGLEGLLLEALRSSPYASETWAVAEYRRAVLVPGLAGPALAPLVALDPGGLVREASGFALTNSFWLPALLRLLTDPGRPTRVRWIAPVCDVAARISRVSDTARMEVGRSIETTLTEENPEIADALVRIAYEPGPTREYLAEDPGSASDIGELIRLALSPGRCWGSVIDRLAGLDPGFFLRNLEAVVEATPGSIGPILGLCSARAEEMDQIVERLEGLGLFPPGLPGLVCRVVRV